MKMNRAGKAPNPFLEVIFRGLTEDKEFKELAKTYPAELIDIFKSRLDMSIEEFGLFLGILDKHPAKLNDQLAKILMGIGRDQLQSLKSEPERFQTKFKKSMFATVNSAKKGHELSIFKLVEWDRAWLATPFMQEIIIGKQQYLNDGFFESLALCIGKKRAGVSPRRSKYKELFLHIKQLRHISKLRTPGALKKLHDAVIDKG